MRSPHLRARLEQAYRQARGEQIAAAGAASPQDSAALQIDIPEVTPLLPCAGLSGSARPRLNLLVPALSEQHVFGGIATALQFIDRLRGEHDVRVLVLDEVEVRPRRDAFYGDWPLYRIAELGGRDPAGSHIVVCGDRLQKAVPVREDDFFIATIWWSAYQALRLIRWQDEAFGARRAARRRFVYLIQDFEPNFYAWSSRHALAASTYRDRERAIAVFNTQLLRDYFATANISFERSYAFEPQLNPALAEARLRMSTLSKERIVLAYGRPSIERNVFPILVAGLRDWIARDPDAAHWQIVSAGEPHGDVELGRGLKLRPLGKLPLAEYADWLARAAIGVSLMVSPHPSYPPLEMAAFGTRVVTNRWANKDLSQWSPLIDSIDPLDPDTLGAALVAQRTAWDRLPAPADGWPIPIDSIQVPGSFLDSTTPFPFVDELRTYWLDGA